MKAYPFVSIIIPAKNEELNIGACLDSIFAGDYPKGSYEVIVVDNGSADGTVEIAKKRGATVYAVPDVNISALRNFGVKKAKGDIVAFVDADCLVSEKWIKEASFYIENKDIVACGSMPAVESDATWVQKTWEYNVVSPKDNISVNWLPSMNLFVKKSIFAEVGGFDNSLVTCEDVDLCYRLRRYGKILSCKSIEIVHLGEPKSLKVFFLRELWQGQNNYQGVLKHGIVLHEIPSLLIPIYTVAIFISLIISIFTVNYVYFFSNLILLILPPLALTLKKAIIKKQFKYFFKLFLLYVTYFFARAISIFIKRKHKIVF